MRSGWGLALLLVWGAAQAQEMVVGAFSAGDLAGWKPQVFKGETTYRPGSIDGRAGLHAEAHGSASGLYREIAVDLERTPRLRWWWRAERLPVGLDERSKAGDDYAVRVYVVVSGGVAFWRTRTLVYVWASHEPAGAHWPNAFTANAQVLALRSGPREAGRWVEESRDVRADFRALFGEDIRRIDAVAVMSDGDNSGQTVAGWYGDLRFTPP